MYSYEKSTHLRYILYSCHWHYKYGRALLWVLADDHVDACGIGNETWGLPQAHECTLPCREVIRTPTHMDIEVSDIQPGK